MSEDEATERVTWAVEQMVRSSALRGGDKLQAALQDFAKAIEAKMACTLLTRETEAMGGYALEQQQAQLGSYRNREPCRCCGKHG